MVLDGTARRRWFGGLMLVTALVLLIAGETVLKDSLHGVGFLIYWLACLLVTGTAIIVAWLDVCAVQRKSRQEARELIERTLGKIETDVRHKPGPRRSEKDG